MILDEIAAATRLRVEQLQRIKDLNKIRSDAESLPKNNRGFRTRLSRDGMNFITEVKKASPSKGIISKEFDYLRLAAISKNSLIMDVSNSAQISSTASAPIVFAS